VTFFSAPWLYPRAILSEVKRRSSYVAGGLRKTSNLDILDTSNSELEIPIKLNILAKNYVLASD